MVDLALGIAVGTMLVICICAACAVRDLKYMTIALILISETLQKATGYIEEKT